MLDSTTIHETIEGNNKRNAKLLEILQEKGIPLAEKRTIDFHFWAWSESDAINLGKALTQSGLAVKEIGAVDQAGESLWNISAEEVMSPSQAAHLEQTKSKVMMAAEFDCVYDGWATRV